MNKLNKQGIFALLAPLRWAIVMGIIYSISSGQYLVLSLWGYVLIYAFSGVMANLWIASKDPNLMNQRGVIKEDTLKYDKILMLIFLIGFVIVMPLVAGLDARAHGIVLGMQSYMIGLIVFLISVIISLKAMLENPFFENLIRLQTDRNHKVIDTGIYRFVRHPGYLGMLLGVLAQPILLRSRLAFWISILLMILVVLRTHKEDEFLEKHLEGYRAYKEKVKDLLIPFIW